MDGLLWFIGLGLCAGLALFSVVFHRVRAELTAARSGGIPRAVIAGGRGGARWSRSRSPHRLSHLRAHPRAHPGGGLRARFAGSLPTVQAGIVATAAMSIFVMALCLMACVVLAVLGR